MRIFVATIQIAIEVPQEEYFGQAYACDAISESLRPLLKINAPGSSIIDWQYLRENNVITDPEYRGEFPEDIEEGQMFNN